MKSLVEREKIGGSFVLLVIYLTLVFFEPQQFLPILKGFRITYVYGIIVLIVGFVTSSGELKMSLIKNRLFRLVVIFVGLCFLSLIISEYPIGRNYEELMKTFSFLLMIILIIRTKTDFIRFCWIVILFAMVNSVLTNYAYHLGIIQTRMVSYFSSLGQSGANEFAVMMAQMIPFPLILLRNKRSNMSKFFLFLTLLSFLYSLTRTRSRTGSIGFLIIMTALIYYRYIKWNHLILLFCLVGFLVIKTPEAYFDRMWTSFESETYETDPNVGHRIETYKIAQKTMFEKPLLGIGVNNFLAYLQTKLEYADEKSVVHNAYLLVGVESGLPAMAVFCAMLIYSFYKLGIYRQKAINLGEKESVESLLISAAKISLLGYAGMAMALGIQFNRIFFMILALTICASNIFEVRKG